MEHGLEHGGGERGGNGGLGHPGEAFNKTGELPEDDATELEAGANRCTVG